MAAAEQTPAWPDSPVPSGVVTSPLVERIRRGIIGEGEVMDGPFGPRRVTYADYTASGRSLDFLEDFIREQVLPRYANTHTESSGTGLATIAGALPGMPGLMTAYMERKMGKLDIPPIPEFIEMIADTGAGLYGCQACCDLFGLGKEDLIDQVTGIITVGEFYALSAGGQIIFT